MNFIFS